MATPHVAGAAALVWSANPSLTAAEVKATLLNSGDYIGDIGANASLATETNLSGGAQNRLFRTLDETQFSVNTGAAATRRLLYHVR